MNGFRLTAKDVIVEPGAATPFAVSVEPPSQSMDTAAGRPDSVSESFTNSIGMTLIRIPAWVFVMGSDLTKANRYERPPHQVLISRAYYLGAHEVTQEQYATIMGTNPSFFAGKPKNPVDSLSWFDAVAFCNRSSARENRGRSITSQAVTT